MVVVGGSVGVLMGDRRALLRKGLCHHDCVESLKSTNRNLNRTTPQQA